MRKWFLRTLLALIAAAVLVAAITAFGRMPKPAVRLLVKVATPWLAAEGPAARLVGAYVEGVLAEHLAERASASEAPDHVALERIVSAVRDQILNPSQLLHVPQDRRALLEGFGYCDQINAAIARTAANRFSSAQLFALYDPVRRVSPHTVGRVWSSDHENWLYFDGFFEAPVIYTKRPDGTVDYLPVSTPPVPVRGKPRSEFYRLSGWVMNEYRASFLGYLGSRLINKAGIGNIEPAPPQEPVDLAALTLPPTPSDEAAYRRVAKRYFAARVDDLLGDAAPSATYRAITTSVDTARDWRAARMAVAARLFAAER